MNFMNPENVCSCTLMSIDPCLCSAM
jgi:hypothetical protein